MTRFPPIDEQAYDEGQMRMAGRASHTGPFHAFMRAPGMWEALQHLRNYLSTSSHLSRPVRELAMLMIAQHWKSPAAFAAHSTMAELAGLPEALIQGIGRGEHNEEAMDEYSRTAAKLVETLLETGRADDVLFARATAVMGEKAVVEMVGLIGFFSTICLTLNLGEKGSDTPAN